MKMVPGGSFTTSKIFGKHARQFAMLIPTWRGQRHHQSLGEYGTIHTTSLAGANVNAHNAL